MAKKILIIDRPISPFSERKDVVAWIEKLNKMPQLPEVLGELSFAKKVLSLIDRESRAPLNQVKSRVKSKKSTKKISKNRSK